MMTLIIKNKNSVNLNVKDEIFNPKIKKYEKIEKNNCTENKDYENIEKKCIKKDVYDEKIKLYFK